MAKKEMQVAAIENGTVIDHIPAEKTYLVADLLDLKASTMPVVLNIIKDYEVVEKKMVETPQVLRGIVRCNNPKCITNNEPMATLFHVVDKVHGVVKCHYCDKEQNMNEIKLV